MRIHRSSHLFEFNAGHLEWDLGRRFVVYLRFHGRWFELAVGRKR